MLGAACGDDVPFATLEWLEALKLDHAVGTALPYARAFKPTVLNFMRAARFANDAIKRVTCVDRVVFPADGMHSAITSIISEEPKHSSRFVDVLLTTGRGEFDADAVSVHCSANELLVVIQSIAGQPSSMLKVEKLFSRVVPGA